ncbi:unnamed protein product [[Candida] boidinii]|nr:unnamed protein product [[Candida] boidinii]
MKAERHYDVLQNWNAFESSASSTLQTQNNESTISPKTSIKNITNNNDVNDNANNTNNNNNNSNNKNIRFNHYTNIKPKRKIEYNDDKDNDADDDDDDNDNKRNLRKGTGKRKKLTSNTKDSKNLNIWNKRLNSNSKPVKSILKKTNHISLSQKAREEQHVETPDLSKSRDHPQELTHSHIDQLLQSSSIGNTHRNGYGHINDHSNGYGLINDHSNGYGHINDHSNGYAYTKKPQFTFYKNGNYLNSR